MNVILIHLADARRLPALIEALKASGAHAATISDNPGMDLVFWRGVRSTLDPSGSDETLTGKTLLSIVPQAVTPSVIAAAETVLGADSGMICAWEVGHVGSFQGDQRAGELVGGRA